MAQARIIDYYSILSLPPTADLTGIANAYARLSDEFAVKTNNDDTSKEALVRLNEAYRVLSSPEQRRKYDAVYFSQDRLVQEKARRRKERRRRFLANVVVAALLVIVVAQGTALAYLGREQVSSAAEVVLGPLFPGSAN